MDNTKNVGVTTSQVFDPYGLNSDLSTNYVDLLV